MSSLTLPHSPRSTLSPVVTAAVLATLAALAPAATITKSTTANTTDLSLGTSWVGGNVPTSTDAATFSGSSLGGTLTLSLAAYWGALSDTGATTAITLSGAPLTLTGGQTLGVATDTGLYISSTGVNLTASNNVVLASTQTWDIASTKTAALSGIISGAGFGITKASAGTLTLSGSNTYSGGTTVTGGKISLNNDAGLGTGALNINSGAASGVTGSYNGTGGSPTNFVLDLTGKSGSTAIGNAINFGTVAGTNTTYGMAMALGTSAAPLITTLSGDINGASNVTLWLDVATSNAPSFSTWVLTGNNSGFAGNIRLNRGNIQFNSLNSMGKGAIFLQTNGSDGFTQVNGVTPPSNLTFGFSGTIANAITLRAGSGTTTSLDTGANNVSLSNLTLSGDTSNSDAAATFVKNGSGTLALTGIVDTVERSNGTVTATSPIAAGAAATVALNTSANIRAGTLDVSAMTPATLTFGSFTGASGTTLNLGAKTLNINGGVSGAFAGTISGTGGTLVKDGTGTLTLAAANTYTGGTTVNAGTVAYANDSAFGSNTITVGATANNGAIVTSSNNIPFLSYTGTTSVVTLANNIALPTTPTTATVYTLSQTGGSSRLVNLNGVLSGGNAFTILELNSETGGGDATSAIALNRANTTLAGTVDLNRGSLLLGNANALGIATLIADSNSNNGTTANGITYGNVTFTVPMTLANNITVSSSGQSLYNDAANPVTLSGVLAGTVAVQKLGGGTLTLTNANTITGAITVGNGALALSGGDNRLPAASVITLGSATANTSGVLSLNGVAQTVAGLASAGAGTGNVVIATSATASTLTITNTAAYTYAGTLGGAGTNNNNFALAKSGNGVLTLTGTGTYTGGTALGAGTLRLKTGAIGTAGTFTLGTATLTGPTDGTALSISNNAFLGTAGSTTTFGDAVATGPIAFTTATGTFQTGTASSDRTLITNVNVSVASRLTGSNGNIVKTGAGRLTLSNAGGTTALTSTAGGFVVGGGTLEVTRLSNAAVASSIGTTSATATTPSITLDGGTLTHIDGDATASSTDRLLAVGRTTAGATGTIRNNATSAANTVNFTNGNAVTYGTTNQTRSLVFGGSNAGANGFATLIGDNGTGAVAVAKQDAGIWALTGANSYTGGTTIDAGTLRADNATSSLGSGPVSVTGSTGVLAGGSSTSIGKTGTGAVTVGTGAANGGGTITAGTGATSADSIGNLATGDQTWKGFGITNGAGGKYVAKFTSNGAAGTGWDLLSINTLTISATSSAQFGLTLLKTVDGTFAANPGTPYTIAHASGLVVGTETVTGTAARTDITSLFALETSGLGLSSGDSVIVSYLSSSGSGYDVQITMQSAPEPTTAALVALGGSAVLGRRRRRAVSAV